MFLDIPRSIAGILRPRAGTLLCTVIGFCAVMSAGPAPAQEDDLLNVYLNHARVIKLDRAVSKVIVGSADIADATVADTRTIVLTGKSVGTTNLVILDAQDNAILDQSILVSSDEGRTLRVYRSTARSILTCTPSCEEHTKK